MKLSFSSAVLSLTLASIATRAVAKDAEPEQLAGEDAQFWDRFLEGGDLSVPTPAPTGVTCEVEVTLDCVTASGIPCNEIPIPPPGSTDCIETLIYTIVFGEFSLLLFCSCMI